jgi:Domain of unknown function (DUF4276)
MTKACRWVAFGTAIILAAGFEVIRIEVLTEGSSDVATVKEVLKRKFGLAEEEHFRIHPHHGRGSLPANPLALPDQRNRTLLHQLPAKLRGYSHWLDSNSIVLVLVDADDTPCDQLLRDLKIMYAALPKKPQVLFRIAIEETESWFLADTKAIKAAYPSARTASLRKIKPDTVVGAWERLAEALGHDVKSIQNSGALKTQWAEKISPNLDLDHPKSPSLHKLIEGLSRYLAKVNPHPSKH